MATGGTSREPSSFGSLVRRFRVAAGLTQEQLAARAGLSPDTIALLERGKRHIPRAGTVRLLADALALGDAERAAFLAAARPEPARRRGGQRDGDRGGLAAAVPGHPGDALD